MELNNVFNGVWQNVNNSTIANIIATSQGISPKANDAEEKKDARTTVEITDQYPWEQEVVSHSVWWDTPQISHITKYIADQIFDDVESAFVEFNSIINEVVGTIYFKFNAKKKSEDGILAFSTLSNETPTNAVEQFIRLKAQQMNGEIIMTKEGQDIISDWIYLPSVDKRDPNWINRINWKNYVDIVPSQSETGYSIRLSGIDVAKMIGMIINHETIHTTDATGKDIEVTKKLEINIIPGPYKKDNPIERLYEIAIVDSDKARNIVAAATGNGTRFARTNAYTSYI